MLTYPDDFSKLQGFNQLWLKDTSAAADVENIEFVARRDFSIAKSTIKGIFRPSSPWSTSLVLQTTTKRSCTSSYTY